MPRTHSAARSNKSSVAAAIKVNVPGDMAPVLGRVKRRVKAAHAMTGAMGGLDNHTFLGRTETCWLEGSRVAGSGQ